MTSTFAPTARSTAVRSEIVPRHASRITKTNATADAITAATDAVTSADPRRSPSPTRSATQRNGPPGSTPGGSTGCSGDPGTEATSAVAPTAITKPAIASVDDRAERSTRPEGITAVVPTSRVRVPPPALTRGVASAKRSIWTEHSTIEERRPGDRHGGDRPGDRGRRRASVRLPGAARRRAERRRRRSVGPARARRGVGAIGVHGGAPVDPRRHRGTRRCRRPVAAVRGP